MRYRFIAFLILTPFAAWVLHRNDARVLAQIDASPTAYLAHERTVHGHSYCFGILACLIIIGAYLAVLELLTRAISAIFRREEK